MRVLIPFRNCKDREVSVFYEKPSGLESGQGSVNLCEALCGTESRHRSVTPLSILIQKDTQRKVRTSTKEEDSEPNGGSTGTGARNTEHGAQSASADTTLASGSDTELMQCVASEAGPADMRKAHREQGRS